MVRMVVLLLALVFPALACDISRWPSTARRMVSARGAGWTVPYAGVNTTGCVCFRVSVN